MTITLVHKVSGQFLFVFSCVVNSWGCLNLFKHLLKIYSGRIKYIARAQEQIRAENKLSNRPGFFILSIKFVSKAGAKFLSMNFSFQDLYPLTLTLSMIRNSIGSIINQCLPQKRFQL